MRKILGHTSIQVTMRYAHPTPENMQRAVDKLGEIFKKTTTKLPTQTYKDKFKTSKSLLFN